MSATLTPEDVARIWEIPYEITGAVIHPADWAALIWHDYWNKPKEQRQGPWFPCRRNRAGKWRPVSRRSRWGPRQGPFGRYVWAPEEAAP